MKIPSWPSLSISAANTHILRNIKRSRVIIVFGILATILSLILLTITFIIRHDVGIQVFYTQARVIDRSLYKTILLWTDPKMSPFNELDSGSDSFLANRCFFNNCFIVKNKYQVIKHVENFDAIIFNGINLEYSLPLPHVRLPYQKYIYFNMESPNNFPVCSSHFDDFFNLTCTYRLDSDIIQPYFIVKDSKGEVIGPKVNMTWPVQKNYENSSILEDFRSMRHTAAAWFISNCNGERLAVAKKIIQELKSYGHTVDIYGKCGDRSCPKKNYTKCQEKLKKTYYFYFLFENSLSEDYVTEKVLTAVNNKIIPIVYGGANYTRFLPPGSYLDAYRRPASEIAKEMVKLMWSPKLYNEYLQRIKPYAYEATNMSKFTCDLCESLNDESLMHTTTVYPHFRKWWYKDFENICRGN